MTGSSPTKKQTRARAAAEKTQKQQSASLSPTAEALQALTNLAAPSATNKVIRHGSNHDNATDQPSLNPEAKHAAAGGLRIQAPAVQSSSDRSGGAEIFGPTTESPAGSGLSSPADDGLDTPDSRDAGGPSKRPRLVESAPLSSTPRTPSATSTPTPPLFLEKTYEMLDKCSPQIACWSPAGDSFIVKNPVAFAEHVIPIYFKHRNFSSFVRQLNFYGFRKVRVVDPDVTGGVDPKDWWEFRHDKFQRGHKELLKEIKRRSLPSSAGGTGMSSGSGTGGGDPSVATVDRGEIDELRSEVATLREQIQTLNKHVFSVMQIMITRNTPTPTASAVTAQALGFSASHVHPHHHPHGFPSHSPHHPQTPLPHMVPAYSFVAGLPPPHLAGEGKPRGAATPGASPGGAMYALRPIQSYMGAMGMYPYPVTPSGDPSLDWDIYSRHTFQAAHVAQAAHAQAAAAAAAQAAATAPPPSSSTSSGSASGLTATATTTATSSVAALAGLKRSRTQQQKRPSPAAATPSSASSTSSTPSVAPVNPVKNPEAAVRQLSMQVTQIRSDLLRSILSRTLAFIRTQPPSTSTSTAKPLATPEIDAIASAITDDIQQRMVQIDEAEAATHGRPRGSAPSETSHMYRVEMLKFVSKELPRAMSEAVEKQLPAPTKKTLNRSLLALMVQKAQAALETQMRTETAPTPPNSSTSTDVSTRTPRN